MKRRNRPDPLGIAIARAVQEEMPQARVILFGSRARGDHRPNSDTDLVVVIPDNADRGDWQVQARWKAAQERERLGTRTGCDISIMTESEFKRNMLATQHVAGQAREYGIDMSNERSEYQYNEYGDQDDEHIEGYDANPESDAEDNAANEKDQTEGADDSGQTRYQPHWPETKPRMVAALEWLEEVNERVDHNSPRQRLLGFAAQQSLENALKAWLSSHNDNRTYGHDFGSLWTEIKKVEDFSTDQLKPVEQAVEKVLDATSYGDSRNPDRRANWLELYAVTYRYGGTTHEMSPEEKQELREKLNDAVSSILDHVHRRSGTTPDDLR